MCIYLHCSVTCQNIFRYMRFYSTQKKLIFFFTYVLIFYGRVSPKHKANKSKFLGKYCAHTGNYFNMAVVSQCYKYSRVPQTCNSRTSVICTLYINIHKKI